jgi:hypothetical protein
MAAGQAFGVSGSSGVSGGTSSLGSQLGGSLGFSSQMSGLSASISSLGQKASNLGAISNLGFTVFGARDDIAGMFPKKATGTE